MKMAAIATSLGFYVTVCVQVHLCTAMCVAEFVLLSQASQFE